ncbi:MAG TPA: DMT family transporter [Thermotogota bacterium]|nr:DMT family transporter [Thermotogota bacterium]
MNIPVSALISGIGVSTIFGLSFLFTSTALKDISPFQLLAYRFLIAAVLLQILRFFRIVKINIRGKTIRPLLLLSVVQPGLYFIFETYGLKYATSSEAGLMISLIPIVVTLMAYFFIGEKTTPVQLGFIALSVGGVVLIVLLKSALSLSGDITGILFLLGAVMAGAAYNILSKKASDQFTPIEITYVMMWFGTILFNTIAIIELSLSGTLLTYFIPFGNPSILMSLLYLGTLSSVLAFFLVNFMLSKIPASRSALFGNLTTIVSIVAGVFINHEPFYWYHIIGSIMILIGIWGVNRFGKAKQANIELEQHDF